MTAYADSMNRTLVGGEPGATNQPTSEGKAWDMGSDMLVVLTPPDQTAIGDPAPPGVTIGQFLPVDDDHGIVRWAEGWDPVTLRAQLARRDEDLLNAQDHIVHLMQTVRWDAEVMGNLLVGDEDKMDHAIAKLYSWLNGPPCTLCDIGRMPNESGLDYLAWVGKRISLSAKLRRMIQEAAARDSEQEVEVDGSHPAADVED